MCSCSAASCSATSCSATSCSARVVSIALSNGGHLLCGLVFEPLVVVGFVVHDGNLGEVFGERRRLDLPFEAGCLPRIVARDRAVLQRPCEVEHRQQAAYAKHRSAGGREQGEHLQLW